MKKWKKIVSMICVLVMCMTMSMSVFATEKTDNLPELDKYISEENAENFQQNVFGMNIVEIREASAIPRKTFYGNGGTCTLDYMDSGKYVAWGVQPATTLPYEFNGEIEIYELYSGSYCGAGVCSTVGIGTANGLVDVASMRLRDGTMYTAVFTGAAIDLEGNTFTIVSGATLNFEY